MPWFKASMRKHAISKPLSCSPATAGIVAAIGHEILARGQSVNRNVAESQRFDDWL
jgi:hypothetical protein